jgi:hypothetical protein
MSGSAVPGLDYTLSTNAGQIVLAAGQRSATVTLNALTNNVKAISGATATMTLQGGSGYTLGSSATRPASTVTIN